MSHRHDELIAETFAIWNESGPGAVAARFWTDDFVYVEPHGFPEEGAYRGREAVLARIGQLEEFVGEIEMHGEEVIEIDDEHVIVCLRMTGTGSQSGAPWDQRFVFLLETRGDRFARCDAFLDRADALAAAGATT